MKKKVLFVLHLPPPVHGAAMVGKFLNESKCLNEAFDADYINLTTAFEMEKIGKLNPKKFTTLLRIQYKVLKALLQKNYDLCYVSLNAKGSGYYKDLLVVILLKFFKKNIIYHFHNRGVATIHHKKMNDLLYRFTFRNTKSILLSKLLYSDISKYVDKRNVFFCPNGIPDLNEFKDTKKSFNSTTETCQILFLSNMMREKGLFVLLDACKTLRDKNIPFNCHFVGSWTEVTEAQVQTKAEQYGLSQHIFLHGKKFGSDKAVFFKSADIFVFPSYYHNECFPLVNLEAMQFGLPIITTRLGGIPDMVIDNETGFLIPPMNTEALVEKLELLISNPAIRARMGLAGRKLYEEFFTLNKFELNMRSILEEAIQQNKN